MIAFYKPYMTSPRQSSLCEIMSKIEHSGHVMRAVQHTDELY
jgi:hypothetical protein